MARAAGSRSFSPTTKNIAGMRRRPSTSSTTGVTSGSGPLSKLRQIGCMGQVTANFTTQSAAISQTAPLDLPRPPRRPA